MDSNDLERERGITILAKNCAVRYRGTHINIVDTPGHADFGGEVERVLSMVDGVLLLVDAVEGPMPQTRFVTRKALALGLKPIVVVNKVDRPGARPEWVVNQTFDLFDKLGATEDQLDFPVVYASALLGYAKKELDHESTDMAPLFEAILKYVPVRDEDPDAPLQLQICSLDYSSYVGKIGIGRIRRGRLRPAQEVLLLPDNIKAKVNQVLMFEGLERKPVDEAEAGDIVLINGIDEVGIGATLCDLEHAGGAAGAQGRRADADHELPGQHLAARRARGQVRHQPPDPRAPRARDQEQRGAARRVPERHRHLHRARPRRAAPDHPAREHAARRLRARGVAPARDLQGDRRREAASRTSC